MDLEDGFGEVVANSYTKSKCGKVVQTRPNDVPCLKFVAQQKGSYARAARLRLTGLEERLDSKNFAHILAAVMQRLHDMLSPESALPSPRQVDRFITLLQDELLAEIGSGDAEQLIIKYNEMRAPEHSEEESIESSSNDDDDDMDGGDGDKSVGGGKDKDQTNAQPNNTATEKPAETAPKDSASGKPAQAAKKDAKEQVMEQVKMDTAEDARMDAKNDTKMDTAEDVRMDAADDAKMDTADGAAQDAKMDTAEDAIQDAVGKHEE